VASTRRLNDIAFLDLAHGYGLFTQSTNTCTVLVGPTSDGGATFGPLVPITASNCGSGAGSGSTLTFDNHGDGFVYDPGLVVTHDGGHTWTDTRQPGTVLSVEALGYSVWMVETACPPGSTVPTCPMQLLESTDGGRTWSRSSNAPSGAVDGYNAGGANGQTVLVRTGPSSAYLVGAPANGATGPHNAAPMWFTSDNGAAWASRPIPCGGPALSIVLSAAPDGTLLAVCAGQPSAGSQLKSAVRSTDGGRTWQVEFACLPMPGNQSCENAPLNFGYLGGIDAVSGTTEFLYGARSSLLVSRNAGATWQVVQPPIGDTGDGSFGAIFFNPSDGIVLAADDTSNGANLLLFSTTDGGLHWTKRVPVAG